MQTDGNLVVYTGARALWSTSGGRVRPVAVQPAQPQPTSCSTSLTWIGNAPGRCEQWRYAKETLNLTSQQFLARKMDFTNQGCSAPYGQAAGCRKPWPYNGYDWTTDGCSWTPQPWKTIFDAPCEQHDFGYRNFGKGLTLGRTEATRAWIYGNFYYEMGSVCATWGWGRQICFNTATAMYSAVRAAGVVGQLWGFGPAFPTPSA